MFQNPTTDRDVIIERFTARNDNHAFINIDIWNNSDRLSAPEWIDAYQRTSLSSTAAIPSASNVQVGGIPGIFIVQPPDYQAPGRLITVLTKDDWIYRIEYLAQDGGNEQDLYMSILSSFEFEPEVNTSDDLPSPPFFEAGPNALVQDCCNLHDSQYNPYPCSGGNCTWYAAYKRSDLPYQNQSWGNAKDWITQARNVGFPTGTTPQVGAIVVFQPGIQGADATYGHVGYVEQVYSSTSFRVTSQSWNGSCGLSNYTANTGSGVDFIYQQQNNACSGPSLKSPSHGYVSTSQTVTFSWSAVSGCTFDGYTVRVKDTSNMDSGGTTIFDEGEGGTSRQVSISTQFNNRDLYWGVKAANAPNGASWSVRQFRIEPGSSCSPNADQVALYVDSNYSGDCVVRGIGDYPNPSSLGIANDSVSSVKVGSNVKVTLCKDDNYGGTCETFTGDDSNLGNNSIGDNKVSSAKVEPRGTGNPVTLYVDPNYGGAWCALTATGWNNVCTDQNDAASSILIQSGWSARVWKDANRQGASRCFTSSVSNFSGMQFNENGTSNLDNAISSFEAYSQTACPSLIPGTPSLSSPANNATLNHTTSVTLSWNTASSATQYYVELWGPTTDRRNSGWTSATSWQFNQISGGTYYWRVQARNAHGVSNWSTTRTFTVRYGTPANLTAADDSGPSTTRIKLAWSASADAPANIDGYRIYRGGSAIATVNSATTTTYDSGLACGTTYSYTVKAYKGSVESLASNTASATTRPCVLQPPQMLVPDADAIIDSRTVTFAWQIATPWSAQIVVNRSPDPEGWPALASWYVTNADSPKDFSAPADGTYYWHMRTMENQSTGGPWATRRFFVDTENPTVTITSPGVGVSYLSQRSILIQAQASDTGSGIDRLQFFAGYNDTLGAGAQGFPEAPPPPPPAGSPADLAVSTPDAVAQAWDWHEIGWDLDGSDGWSLLWDTSGVPDQAGISIFIYAYDKSWKLGSDSHGMLTLDRTPPTGQMVAPTPGSIQDDPIIVLQADAWDNVSGIHHVDYWGWSTSPWSDQEWTFLGRSSTYPFQFGWNVGLVDEAYYQAIEAGLVWVLAEIVDNAGNITSLWGNGEWTYFTIRHPLPDVEVQALEALYNRTNGPNWTDNTGWLTSDHPCDWFGVYCANGHVTALDLSYNNLTGSLPPALGNLSELEWLALSNNQLTGSIPASLGGLTNLFYLSLWANQLSGAIPAELGNLSALQILELADNQLSGALPATLGNLSNLYDLWLSWNDIGGAIPPELGNLSSLEYLYLWDNQLTGTIPAELGNLTNLAVLSLGYNQLTGSVPASLGNLSSLESLYLNNNQLSGVLPATLGNLGSLTWLNVSYNQLTGSIPSQLGSLANLEGLYLFNNQLAGALPPELGNLTNLIWMNLSNNQLAGSIPASLGSLGGTGLGAQSVAPEMMEAAERGIASGGGGDHAEEGELQPLALTGLTGLWLSNNQLSGTIPAEVGDLTNLTTLDLSRNDLTGDIPASLGDLSHLVTLDLSTNHLTGGIPPQLGQLAQLERLLLAVNRLEGSIPPEIGNLTALKMLRLTMNQLSGEIPAELSNLNLEELAIGYNMLTTSDAALDTYLNSVSPGWRVWQTLPPTSVQATAISNTEVQVSWNETSIFPGQYRVSYSTAPGAPYTAGCATPDKSTSSCIVDSLLPGTTYYFVVQNFTAAHGYQQNDLLSGYSQEASAETPLLGTPPLVSPANGAVTTDNRPTLAWNAVTGAEAYRLQVDDSPAFDSPVLDQVLTGTSFLADVTLHDGTTYYWRAQARTNAGETGAWGLPWSFTVDTVRLPAPRLNAPRDRTTTPDDTPRFTWAAVRGADRYHLQVSDQPGFPDTDAHPLLVDDDTLTRPNFTVPDASRLPYGPLYWRARAHDAAGNWGDWSTANTFTVTPLKTPRDGDFTKDTTPRFRWAGVRGAARYWLQVSTDTGFTNLLVDEDSLTRVTFTPAGALPFGPLYWRVQVDLGDGYPADPADYNWTPTQVFTVTPSVPVKPVLQSPANRTATNATPDQLTWQPLGDGATYRYQVQLDDQPNFRSPLQDATLDPDVTTYVPAPLSENGRVFWRVRAINEYGVAGQWSATWWFRLDALPRPTLTAPANRSTTENDSPTFVWTAVPGAGEYQVQISRDRKFGTVEQAAAVTDATYPAGGLPDGRYYWRARAVNANGIAGQWSAVWQITIDHNGPDAPVLRAPRQGSATPDTTPRLAWKASRGAQEYRVQVDVSTDFDSPDEWAGLGATSFTLPDAAALDYGTYFWRVRARDARNVWGMWSDAGTFTVTVHKSPADGGATTNDRPTFSWAGVAGAQYRLQISAMADIDADPNPLVDELRATTSYRPPAGLAYGTLYWRVSLDDGTSWMPTWAVTITPAPPARVGLSAPKNGTLTNDSTPTLLWKAALRGETYQVQIDDDRKFGSPAQDVTLAVGALTYTADALPDGAYFWRVRSLNAFDAPGPWSAVWRLEIDTTPPDAPALVTPEDTARVTNRKLKLEWGRVSDAARYEVQLDPDPAFPLPPVDTARRTTYRPPTTLAQNVYYWRVRAVDKAGNVSAWSAPRSFSLVAGNTALTEPLPTPTPTATEAVEHVEFITVEAEDPAVIRSGAWAAHDTPDASGGAYLYSSGSAEDMLSLRFRGTRLEVVYVGHPALGSFVIEVDGAPLAVVDSATPDSVFGTRETLEVADGEHVLRVYPQTGTIAIDAFTVDEVIAPEPVLTPTLAPVTATPTAEPDIDTPIGTPLPTGTSEPTETPIPTGTPLPTEPPTATPLPTEPPTDTPAPTVEPTSTPLPTDTPPPTSPPEPTVEPTVEPLPTEDVLEKSGPDDVTD